MPVRGCFQCAVLLVSVGAFASLGLADVRINEVQSTNTSTVVDDFGDASDWIELYNDGATAVNLLGWGISDDQSLPFKCTFKGVFIQPGQCLLIWASDRDGGGLQQHVNFKISGSGEAIVLTKPDGTRADIFPATLIPRDRSMGRSPDGVGPIGLFAKPTPRALNTSAPLSTTLVAQPTFSVPGGAYTDPVSVHITSSVAGGTIRYTTDGSDPNEASPMYEGPILLAGRHGEPNWLSEIPTNQKPVGPPYDEGWQPPSGEVFKIHVLRASVFTEGALPSRITTQSYLIDPMAAARYPFPIVSLATTPANLFDPKIGIYVKGNSGLDNYMEEGPLWERSGHLEFFESGGALAFKGEVGIRLHGNTTVSRPRKALRIYSRPSQSSSPFNYRLFPEKTVAKFETFLLRNGGNDWGQSILRDSLVSDFASTTGLDRMATRPAVVFVDGEYWGLHDVRDRIDDGYFLNHYGLPESDYTQLEVASSAPQYSAPAWERGNSVMLADYEDILARCSRGEYADAAGFAALSDRIDVDNFIDYLILEMWCGNTDWPGNNMRLWRKVLPNRAAGANARHDGRWRWILFDTDFAFALLLPYVTGSNADGAVAAQFDSLRHATVGTVEDGDPHWATREIATRLIRTCLENPVFRERFVSRACDLLNTLLAPAGATARLDAMAAVYEPGMVEHALRWRQPVDWHVDVARIRAYLEARPAAMFGHMERFFGVPGVSALGIDVGGSGAGTVRVNSIPLAPGTPGVANDPYPWVGKYLQGIPVTLTAHADAGSRFAGWEDSDGLSGVDPDAASVQLTLAGPRSLKAIFEPASCQADLDLDGRVDFGDVALAMLDFGPCDACVSDLDGSGVVDFADLAWVLLEFGPCP